MRLHLLLLQRFTAGLRIVVVILKYRDTVVRHRRSMLRLNSVVGQRLLP